ncbi:hypothetical protein PROFUN_11559 [Planoprotostelium fungivorum]|uniref:Alpha-mannosidase n=1 Tax=Planoprotostelium fungivorum TaxID=1890364 RepID=A0A2P6N9I4_9EUKA|nr:hypothetical protein PROFUN_11559 [Planoprotostelium fungivorum]
MATMRFFVLLALLIPLYAISVHLRPPSAEDVLDVHIIAHSHDDVGWLKTVDEYYTGFNQSIQDAGVQYILDAVTSALEDDPDRRFIYVEIAFFERWWRDQSEKKKASVRRLVKEGRFEFINGDEATTHYSGVIDQMTLGHQFLMKEFGVRPKIGWHVDPFGHAATQATLFSDMGFDAFFFGRIDYQEQKWRNDTREMEFIWRNSKSRGEKTDMWSHVLYASYSYLPGFAWEYGDEPIQDDPRLFRYNVRARADVFAELVRERAATVKHNRVLIPFGEDFQFEKALLNFRNMEKLMKFINGHPEYKMKLRYSTPSIYLQSVKESNPPFNIREGDFFPYADRDHAYWTGFYSSRPTLKLYARQMNGLAHASDKLFAAANFKPSTAEYRAAREKTSVMDDAYGIVQHHDALAGTEKLHVAEDYILRLSMGQHKVEEVVGQSLGKLMGAGGDFGFCHSLNESICEHTEDLNGTVAVTFYNPVAWQRSHFPRFPVTSTDVEVMDSDGQVQKAELFPNADDENKYDLVFVADIPPMGYATYFISSQKTDYTSLVTGVDIEGGLKLDNSEISLTFSDTTGRLDSATNLREGIELDVTLDYLWYNSSTGTSDNRQASGAYIFRPNGTYPISDVRPSITLYNGTLLKEVRQKLGPWLSHSIRLWQGTSVFEVENTVDTIDISDGLGKEISMKFSSSLQTDGKWSTDSMGVEMIERRRNVREWPFNITEPISWNYVPVNEAAYLSDSSTRLTLVVDRSRGCSSLEDGSIETMLQRRTLMDDRRGVGEPLNGTERVRSSTYVHVSSESTAAPTQRSVSLLINNPAVVAFRTVDSTSIPNGGIPFFSRTKRLVWSGIRALPQNLHVLNVRPLDDGTLLVRLHHLYEKDEHSVLSQPISVNLTEVFSSLKIASAQEVSLTANAKVEGSVTNVEIGPTETKTFLIRLKE